jgi:hypothetical protein
MPKKKNNELRWATRSDERLHRLQQSIAPRFYAIGRPLIAESVEAVNAAASFPRGFKRFPFPSIAYVKLGDSPLLRERLGSDDPRGELHGFLREAGLDLITAFHDFSADVRKPEVRLLRNKALAGVRIVCFDSSSTEYPHGQVFGESGALKSFLGIDSKQAEVHQWQRERRNYITFVINLGMYAIDSCECLPAAEDFLDPGKLPESLRLGPIDVLTP